MKVRKKQNGTKISDMLTDFDDRAKGCFLKSEEFGDLSDHILSGRDTLPKENFSTVDQLDIMDISVSNFQFSTFNKIELEGLDMINEDDFIEKDELFQTDLVSNGSKDLEEVNSFEGVTLSLPKAIEDTSKSDIEESGKIKGEPSENSDEPAGKLSKRALKRKKQLEESKPQCPVRTTARHFTKMFDFFEANPGLATGQLPKIIYRKKWRELTDLLNQQGIGEKTTEKWQKTWSDYKLHLRKKLSGIKRSGKALDVPNQFTEQDKRALINMGVSLCDEVSIKRRFNPESEDSSSHSATLQPTLQPTNIPAATIPNTHFSITNQDTNSCPPTPKKPPKPFKQQRQRKLADRRRKLKKLRHFRAKTAEYQKRSLAELRSLRTILDNGLSRIGDVLERLANNSESNVVVAKGLMETAAQIATSAGNLAEVISGFNKHSNTQC